MKQRIFNLSVLLALVVGMAACAYKTQQADNAQDTETVAATGTFGEAIVAEGALAVVELPALFQETDSVAAKISGHISASCKHSGCWMELQMGADDALYVTFKDEGYTIPLDAAGKNAVIEGIAYRQLIPVETLQNYAREEGLSEDEIAAITEPVYEYEFVAKGVIIEN